MSTDDVPDDLPDSADSIPEPKGSKTYSYAYLTALFLTIVGGLVGAIYFGVIDPDIVVSAVVEVGWIIEYTVAALALLFVFWTLYHIVNVAGVGFATGVADVVLDMIDQYERNK